MTLLQAKGPHDCCDPQDLGESGGEVPLLGPGRNQPCCHLESRILTSRAGRQSVAAVRARQLVEPHSGSPRRLAGRPPHATRGCDNSLEQPRTH